MLAGRHLPSDSTKVDWAYFELVGSADTALVATVVTRDSVTRDSVTHTTHLTKGTPYTGDYFCEEGWLQLSNSSIPNLWDTDMTTPQFLPRRHALRIAPGANKALVARLDFIDFEEFTVWCGDGCKGFPLPWTFKTRSAWSSARAWNANSVSLYSSGIGPPHDVLSAAMQRRLWLEEQALENGPDIPGQADIQQRARAAIVPGLLLRAVSLRDSSWRLSVEFEHLLQLEQFMTRLSETGRVAELGVIPLYRAKLTNGHWTDVIAVRYER